MQVAEPPSRQPAASRLRWLDRIGSARAWIGDRRTPYLVFVLCAIVACAVLLYLGRRLTFFGDEWEFIMGRRDLTIQNLFRPHNEHWSLFPVLAYEALLSVVGLHSYLPYLVLLLAVHVTAVAALFVLLRQEAGPLVAVGGAALLFLLGKAYEDLFWAFQIGFIGSVAAGLWALVVIEASVERRAVIAIGLLLFVAVASSGLGLVFLVAVGTRALIDRSRRRGLAPVAAVGLVYLAWFALFGRTGLNPTHAALSVDLVAAIPAAVMTGGGRGIGGLLGIDRPLERVLFVVLVAVVVWRFARGHRVPGLAVAAVVALIAEFILIGLARDPLVGSGATAARASRYVYSSAVLVLIVLAGLVGGYTKRSITVKQGAVVSLVVVFCLVGNVRALQAGSLAFETRAAELRAAVAWVEAHPGSPLIGSNVRPTPFTPDVGVADLIALATREGSVTRDDLLPGVVPRITPEDTDQALFGMVKADFHILPTNDLRVDAAPPRIVGGQGVVATEAGGCLALRAAGPAPELAVEAPAGTSILFVPEGSGHLRANLALLAGPQNGDSVSVEVIGGQPYSIAIPDVGAGAPWTLTLIPPVDPVLGRLCSRGGHSP